MAAKLKDGLFVSDADVSQSDDFINDNKISNLVNLSGREVGNIFASHGLVYLTFNWEDKPDFKLRLLNHRDQSSDKRDFVADLVEFIDVSIQHGISVLLFSTHGTGRCIVAACVYFMVKYRWGFEKAFEFVYTKKPDASLNRGFVQQLFAFDKHLLLLSALPEKRHIITNHLKQKSMANEDPSTILSLIASAVLSKEDYQRWKGWDPSYLIHSKTSTASNGSSTSTDYDNDELLLIYSHLNSRMTLTKLPGPFRGALDTPKRFLLRFNEVLFEENVNWFPREASSSHASHTSVKSCLKGGNGNGNGNNAGKQRPASPRAPGKGSSSNSSSSSFVEAKDTMMLGEEGLSEASMSTLDSQSVRGMNSFSQSNNNYSNNNNTNNNNSNNSNSSSNNNNNNSQNGYFGRSNNLYGFIGVAKDGNSAAGPATMNGSSGNVSSNGPNNLNNPSSNLGAKGVSADDRLRHLVSNLHVTSNGNPSSFQPSSMTMEAEDTSSVYTSTSIHSLASQSSQFSQGSQGSYRNPTSSSSTTSNPSSSSHGAAGGNNGNGFSMSLHELAHSNASSNAASTSNNHSGYSNSGSSTMYRPSSLQTSSASHSNTRTPHRSSTPTPSSSTGISSSAASEMNGMPGSYSTMPVSLGTPRNLEVFAPSTSSNNNNNNNNNSNSNTSGHNNNNNMMGRTPALRGRHDVVLDSTGAPNGPSTTNNNPMNYYSGPTMAWMDDNNSNSNNSNNNAPVYHDNNSYHSINPRTTLSTSSSHASNGPPPSRRLPNSQSSTPGGPGGPMANQGPSSSRQQAYRQGSPAPRTAPRTPSSTSSGTPSYAPSSTLPSAPTYSNRGSSPFQGASTMGTSNGTPHSATSNTFSRGVSPQRMSSTSNTTSNTSLNSGGGGVGVGSSGNSSGGMASNQLVPPPRRTSQSSLGSTSTTSSLLEGVSSFNNNNNNNNNNYPGLSTTATPHHLGGASGGGGGGGGGSRVRPPSPSPQGMNSQDRSTVGGTLPSRRMGTSPMRGGPTTSGSGVPMTAAPVGSTSSASFSSSSSSRAPPSSSSSSSSSRPPSPSLGNRPSTPTRAWKF